jgi:hypothetical protein
VLDCGTRGTPLARSWRPTQPIPVIWPQASVSARSEVVQPLICSITARSVNPVLAHFPFIVELQEEYDRHADGLTRLFSMTARGSLPNSAVALRQPGFFDVRPVGKKIVESYEELPELLATHLGGLRTLRPDAAAYWR